MSRILTLLILFCVLVAPLVLNAQKPEESYAQAMALLNGGKWQEARDFAVKYQSDEEKFAWATYVIAKSYQEELYSYELNNANKLLPTFDSMASYLQQTLVRSLNKKSKKKERFLAEKLIGKEEMDSLGMLKHIDSLARIASRYVTQTSQISANKEALISNYFAAQSIFVTLSAAHQTPLERYLYASEQHKAALKEVAESWQGIGRLSQAYMAYFKSDTLDARCLKHRQQIEWDSAISDHARDFQRLSAMDFKRPQIKITAIQPWIDTTIYHIETVQRLRAEIEQWNKAVIYTANIDSMQRRADEWSKQMKVYEPDNSLRWFLEYRIALANAYKVRNDLYSLFDLFFVDRPIIEQKMHAILAGYEHAEKLLYKIPLDTAYYVIHAKFIRDVHANIGSLEHWQQAEHESIKRAREELLAKKTAAISLARIELDAIPYGQATVWIRPDEKNVLQLYESGGHYITEQAISLPDAGFLLKGRMKDGSKKFFIAKVIAPSQITWLHTFDASVDSIASIGSDGGKGSIYVVQRAQGQWKLGMFTPEGQLFNYYQLNSPPKAIYPMYEPSGALLVWESTGQDASTILEWKGYRWEQSGSVQSGTLMLKGNVVRPVILYNSIKLVGNYFSIQGWDGQAFNSGATDGGYGTNIFVATLSLNAPWTLHVLNRSASTIVKSVSIEPGGLLLLQGLQGRTLQHTQRGFEGGIPWQEYAESN